MQELARLWRLFPKLAMGGSAVLLFLLGLWGADSVNALVSAFASLGRTGLSEGLQVGIALVTIGAAAKGGASVASGVASALAWLGHWALRPLFLRRAAADSLIAEILSTSEDLVKNTLIERKSYYLTYIRLKSIANEKLDQVAAIEKYLKDVERHIDSIDDWSVLVAQAFVGCLSQDQRKIEIIEDNVRFLAAFAVVALASTVLIPLCLSFAGVWAVVPMGILVTAGTLVRLAQEKRFLACFIVGSYLDNFIVAGMSDYGERAGDELV